MEPVFRDRRDAGRRLAALLGHLAGDPELLVLGLPRGGVPVAAEVAAALGAPLDLYVVRKLGAPGRRELAMGAIASGGVRVLNEPVAARIPRAVVEEVARAEERKLEHSERALRGDRPAPAIRGRTVLLVDDGIATGSTVRSAIAALRTLQAGRIVVAVPVVAPETRDDLAHEVDEVVAVVTPEPMAAISLWYENFSQTADEEVRRLLEQAARNPREPSAPP